ncbi:DUF1129 domain-containing protein [Bacillus cereus group sp. TH43LC]|uniref:DUF1129 domain-containing protein n=1 Tax=Bacillus cereus group TaxID=86661 RepID=UPI00187903F4|nr:MULTISPECIES: DUF1129 domain-containing protein [Bacillus cereus group]MBE7140709.1 DUF1129 domain-containing protein [Bacillus paranthracis]MDA1503257.1 DUF1129 domain-containing protein [Bacillus cereus group sp. TH43LC]MDA1790347.1 DUF1129 domain-containing protein [Bacillus cereus group sp. BY5-1LC]MDA1865434.1 DUF1129 domain-containing protein [Bacillus cereus group sp. BY128LC]
MQISKEGEKFLIDTKVYLTTKGMKEEDVDAFLEDAELHLIEGEKRGKNVEDIFGDSPKEYANQLVKEMQVDYKRNLGWLATAVISILCYWTIPDLLFRNLNEPYTISLIGLIGYPVILLLMIMGGVLFLRGASFQRSMLKKGLLLFGAVILTYLPILIMFLKGWYSLPLYELPQLGRYLIGGVMLLITTIVNVRSLGWIGLLVLGIPIFMIFMVEQIVRVYF